MTKKTKELNYKQIEEEFDKITNYLNADYGVDEYKSFLKQTLKSAMEGMRGKNRKIEYGTDIINDTKNALTQHQNMGYNLRIAEEEEYINNFFKN